jgi:hypothetical protein
MYTSAQGPGGQPTAAGQDRRFSINGQIANPFVGCAPAAASGDHKDAYYWWRVWRPLWKRVCDRLIGNGTRQVAITAVMRKFVIIATPSSVMIESGHQKPLDHN